MHTSAGIRQTAAGFPGYRLHPLYGTSSDGYGFAICVKNNGWNLDLIEIQRLISPDMLAGSDMNAFKIFLSAR